MGGSRCPQVGDTGCTQNRHWEPSPGTLPPTPRSEPAAAGGCGMRRRDDAYHAAPRDDCTPAGETQSPGRRVLRGLGADSGADGGDSPARPGDRAPTGAAGATAAKPRATLGRVQWRAASRRWTCAASSASGWVAGASTRGDQPSDASSIAPASRRPGNHSRRRGRSHDTAARIEPHGPRRRSTRTARRTGELLRPCRKARRCCWGRPLTTHDGTIDAA